MKKIQCFTLLPQNISDSVVLNAALIEDTSATLQSMLIHIIKVYKGNLHTHHQGVQRQSCKIEFDHRNLTGVLQCYPLP